MRRPEIRKPHVRLIWILLLSLALMLVLPDSVQSQTNTEVAPDRHVLVSIPDRKLAVLENGKVIRIFPVSVGARTSPSPGGSFRIVTRIVNPTYYHPHVVIPPGPDNPVGPRWVGLSRKGYGIHGTNDPQSIGRAASHGCIRLRNKDVEELFSLVRIGGTVEIRAQRDSETSQLFGGEVVWTAVRTEMSSAAGGQ